MKKIICLITFIIIAGMNTVLAEYKSDWAVESVELAKSYNMLPEEFADCDFTLPVTRNEVAKLITNAHTNIIGGAVSTMNTPFADIGGSHISTVYEWGVMTGKSENMFVPDDYTTREEMSKIILLFKAKVKGEEPVMPMYPTSHFTDFWCMNAWAKPYVSKANAEGIINGYDDGTFHGEKTVSREEAVCLVLRASGLYDKELPVSDAVRLSVENYVSAGNLTISWSRVPDVSLYNVKVTEKRNSYYEGDIPANNPFVYEVQWTDSINIYVNPNRTYIIELIAGDYYVTEEVYVQSAPNEGGYEISANYPTTKEEAEALQTDISVPVWKLKNGEKISSTAVLTVHRDIADKVWQVFDEIYRGPEKFPVKDVGAFNWRGKRSEHNGGTAIDINYNENYCIYKDGSIVGEYWKPGEDPYSISPYGDVIRAFEKYGFTWGGDSWSSPKDYMHFSYLGT